jgi:hypothetical protein
MKHLLGHALRNIYQIQNNTSRTRKEDNWRLRWIELVLRNQKWSSDPFHMHQLALHISNGSRTIEFCWSQERGSIKGSRISIQIPTK